MIRWTEPEMGEGVFKSKLFRDDEGGDELCVYVKSLDLAECAEKCVAALNSLTDPVIDELCEKLISCAKEGGINEEFVLPELSHVREILNYCWFTSLYVDMADEADAVAYVLEGEGDWGEAVGFAVRDGQVVYVGVDYFDFMEHVE